MPDILFSATTVKIPPKLSFLVQGVGFEPTKANANRFTVCRV